MNKDKTDRSTVHAARGSKRFKTGHGHARAKGSFRARIRSFPLAALVLLLLLLTAACSSNDRNDAGNAGSNTTSSGDAASAGESAPERAPSAHDDAAADSGSRDTGKDSGDSSIAEGGTGDRSHDSGVGGHAQQPQAGLLTAGQWNDLAKWNEWETLLASHEGRDNRNYWSFYRFDRLTVQVNGGGKPISDAQVSVIGKNGQSVWEARTGMDGRASVFAGMFGQPEQRNASYKETAEGDFGYTSEHEEDRNVAFSQGGSDSYLIEVKSGGQTKRFENVDIPRDGNLLAIDFDKAAPASNKLDLMFTVDTTGSMSDELYFLKTELKDVVERVAEHNGQQLSIRVSANFYRDEGDDYVVKPFPFTADIDKTVRQISDQRANGGGDFPEAVDQALDDAIHGHDWSADARARLLFLVLDAPPHHDRSIVERVQRLTQEAAGKGIRIIPVASSGVDVNTEYLMRFMAVSTGGTYLFLTDHSGIGDDHLEPAVGEYEVKALNKLLVDVINSYCAEGQAGGSE